MANEADADRKRLCFVVGPIGSSGTEIRKHADMLLHGVVREAINDADLNYDIRRADEDTRPGMINDRIIHDILNADLVIADLTDLNPNVFYELGIRHAASKPTIHIAKINTKLPFDNAGHDTIFIDVSDWHDIGNARSRLRAAIKAIDEESYRVSNPITQARASFALKESTDPKDKIIAEMRDKIYNIERMLIKPDTSLAPNLSVEQFQMNINWICAQVSKLVISKANRNEIVDYLIQTSHSLGLYCSGISFSDGAPNFILSGIHIFMSTNGVWSQSSDLFS